MISNTNHDSSEGEQWGRYNLPRFIAQKKTIKAIQDEFNCPGPQT